VALNTVVVFPRGWIQDDAFFYAQIAYNIATAGLSSFDGINVTNGYHFLWGWMLAAVSFGVSALTHDKHVHLLAMVALYFWLVTVTAVTYGKSFRHVVLLLCSFFMLTVLMETVLLVILLLFISRSCLGQDVRSTLNDLQLLLAFFLIPLVRIDATLIGLIAAFAFYRRPLLAVCLVASTVLGAASQLAFSKILFGEYLSVVTLIKAGSGSSLAANVLSNLTGENGARLASVITLYLLALVTVASAPPSQNRFGAAAICTGCLGFVLFHTLFNRVPRPWYYLPCYVILPYIVVTVGSAHSLARRLYLAAHCLLLASYLTLKGVEVTGNHLHGIYRGAMQFARGIRVELSENDKAFMVDGSGFVGYFSERHVVNGDGLVNTFAYARAMRANALGNYLKDNDIRFIITNASISGDYLVNFGGIQVRGDDAEEIIATTAPAPLVEFKLFRLKSAPAK